jgi:lysozyme
MITVSIQTPSEDKTMMDPINLTELEFAVSGIFVKRESWPPGTVHDYMDHGRQDNLLHYIIDGSRTYQIDGHEKILRPGTLIFIPEGTKYRTETRRPTSGIGICFHMHSLDGTPILLERDVYTVENDTLLYQPLFSEMEQATEMLKQDVAKFEKCVTDSVKVPVTQSMFNALVSFCYNVGQGAFKTSTLLKKLNKKDYNGACEQFERWNKSGGKVLGGLVKRRAKEQKEFLRMGTPETKPSDVPSLKGYKGFSIVDGLKSFGYPHTFAYRKTLWAKIGKTSKYKGTATQNLQLLNYLKGV